MRKSLYEKMTHMNERGRKYAIVLKPNGTFEIVKMKNIIINNKGIGVNPSINLSEQVDRKRGEYIPRT